MKNKIFSVLKFSLGWPLSLLALFFLIKLIAPQAPQFFSRLHEISYPLVIVGILCFLVYFFLRGYIWKRLVKQAGYDLSYKDTNYIWAASELQRYIPGNVWSFLGRTVRLAEKGMSKKDIAKCTVYEIEFLILGAAITSLLAIPFLVHHFGLLSQLALVILIGFLFCLLLFVFQKNLRLKLFLLPNFDASETVFLLFLNSILFFFFGLGYVFTFASFIVIDPNLVFQLTGVALVSFLVGYLSFLTPSGIGVREGALVVALSKIMSASAAGFVALFARFILIIAEIIYVVFSYLWQQTKNKYITKAETWIGEHKQLSVLIALFVVYVIYFTTVTFLRFDNFYTGKFDLGNMSQTVWNTTQGRIFTLTNPDTSENVSRLAIHADFILILLAPFYALLPDPRNLLFIQTAVLASGCFFVYLIAKEILKHTNLALVFAFLFLLNPSVQRTNLYDFHAVTLATTFFLGAFYFFIKKQYRYFLLFVVLAGICKEQLWLTSSLFGIFLFFHHKKRIFGIILFVSCLLLTYGIISYAMPQVAGEQHFALSYFSQFGDSPVTIVKNILFNPQQTLSIILEPDRLNYLKQLLLPVGYLSLLAPFYLVFAGPDLGINLLSNNAQLHQIYYQYTSTITPFLFIAAIYGVSSLRGIILWIITKQSQANKREIATTRSAGLAMTNVVVVIYLLAVGVYGAYAFGPLPGSRDANLDMITKPAQDKQLIASTLVTIPQEAKVAASNSVASHLTHREYLFISPLGLEKAEYIVFYLTKSQAPESLQADKELVEKFRKDSSYEIVVEKGIFIVFKKRIASS